MIGRSPGIFRVSRMSVNRWRRALAVQMAFDTKVMSASNNAVYKKEAADRRGNQPTIRRQITG